MIINRISIFDEFSCLMGACPINCCRGWNIPIEPELVQKYNETYGYEKIKFIRSLKKKDGVTTFKSRFFACPFFGKDNLCSIQKSKGTEFMPGVCVIFPRSLYNTGFFCEETLYLACPGAAMLFIKRARSGGHFYYTSHEGIPDYEINSTNDDKDFLDYLLKTREQIVNALDEKIRYNSLSLLDYAYDAQNACTENTHLPDIGKYTQNNTEKFFNIDYESLESLIMNGFYHPRLLPRMPYLYKLCRLYRKEFPKIKCRKNPEFAAKKLKALNLCLYDKLPDLDLIQARFYEYYIQKSFLNIFEDYSFAKHIFLGMVKTQIITLFLALIAKNENTVTDDDIANVITVFERRALLLETPYFNSLLSDVLKRV